MSGLFDKLENELANRGKDGGISPLDLVDLPSQLRKLMRHMLREVEVSFDKLWDQVETMKEIDKFSKEELRVALTTLTKQGWLISRGEEDNRSYRVNLRRKRGSSLSGSIWSALDSKMDEVAKALSENEEDSK